MAQPVQPLLASQICDLDQQSIAKDKNRRLGFGCRAIDQDVLRGGLDYGSGGICALSAEKGIGCELALHAATAHLLSHDDARAFYIDTNGTFAPRRLNEILLARIGNGSTDSPDPARQSQETRAGKILERVALMRVFDFAGLMEAVGEISGTLSDASKPRQNAAGEKLRFVADSQAEAEEDYAMADALTTTTRDSPTSAPLLIVISNMPACISPLVRSSPAQGHALLVLLLRNLQHLAQQHPLCVVIVNGTVPSGSELQHHHPSAFADVKLRPALGSVFAHRLDVSLLASTVQREDGKEVHVLEVLADRCGARTGRWAGFEVRGAELKEVV